MPESATGKAQDAVPLRLGTRHAFRRVVCLTEETTETLYRIGAEDRLVGISTFVVRPPRAKREKPVVSQFTKADTETILAVEPDLVLAFSDLQADICAALIRAGVEVHCFNHRSVPEILGMIRTVAALVDLPERGEALAEELVAELRGIEQAAAAFPVRPRVYFEEWHDPIITGIRWVTELIEIAGGIDVFPEFREARLAKDRTLSDPGRILERKPDIYLASWCGRKFRRDWVEARPGWAQAPFVRDGHVHAIDSGTILQPGPGALTDGVRTIHRILADFAGSPPAPVALQESSWPEAP